MGYITVNRNFAINNFIINLFYWNEANLQPKKQCIISDTQWYETHKSGAEKHPFVPGSIFRRSVILWVLFSEVSQRGFSSVIPVFPTYQKTDILVVSSILPYPT